jgi:hypothetical protein
MARRVIRTYTSNPEVQEKLLAILADMQVKENWPLLGFDAASFSGGLTAEHCDILFDILKVPKEKRDAARFGGLMEEYLPKLPDASTFNLIFERLLYHARSTTNGTYRRRRKPSIGFVTDALISLGIEAYRAKKEIATNAEKQFNDRAVSKAGNARQTENINAKRATRKTAAA